MQHTPNTQLQWFAAIAAGAQENNAFLISAFEFDKVG